MIRGIPERSRKGLSMLFCITANYTPKAMEAMAKNPNTNRRDALMLRSRVRRKHNRCLNFAERLN
jgi:hypothetical protein